jgi:molybdate-binding protein/DNA-binding XRE family transcriptional regulator
MEQPHSPNRVRQSRLSRGWSQADLAQKAGISRTAVSAIEIDRLVPSVTAALALAATFGCTVESLFGTSEATLPQWAWNPIQPMCRYWQAQVGTRWLRYPVEDSPTSNSPHDGIFREGVFQERAGRDCPPTLVIASCDPAAGLLAAEYARTTGFRLLVLPRSSREALRLLKQGLIHAAGLHFASSQTPQGNDRAVAELLGAGYRLLRMADWQEGLAFSSGSNMPTVHEALKAPRLRWVGREVGSAARQCLDDLRPQSPAPRKIAQSHRGVVEALRSGWGDVGVCHRLVAEEAGLPFLSVRQEEFDLCYSEQNENDPRMVALVRLIQSATSRQLFGDLPGFDTHRAGELRAVTV